MLGIIPAAGRGSRIQPLGFSKELLPVGSRHDGKVERPCAVNAVVPLYIANADHTCGLALDLRVLRCQRVATGDYYLGMNGLQHRDPDDGPSVTKVTWEEYQRG